MSCPICKKGIPHVHPSTVRLPPGTSREFQEIRVIFLCESCGHTWEEKYIRTRGAESELDRSIQERQVPEKKIMNQPIEALAQELFEFALKNFPESIQRYSFLDHHITDAFWEEKGLSRFPDDPKLRLYMERVAFIAREIVEKERGKIGQEILKGRNEKELIAEMAGYLCEKLTSSELSEANLQLNFEQFWNQNYPEVASDYKAGALRRTIEKSVKFNIVLHNLVEWARKAEITKMRKADVKMFLMNKGIRMGWDDTNVLFHEVERRIKKE